jgi:hypothetical protein
MCQDEKQIIQSICESDVLVDDSLIDMWSKSGSKEDVWSGKWTNYEKVRNIILKTSTTPDAVKHGETFFSVSGGHVSKCNFSFSKGGSLEKWNACSGWHFTFFLLFCDTCIPWVSQEKMKKKFCTCFMFFNTLGVMGSSNKHPLAMLRWVLITGTPFWSRCNILL